MRSLITYLCEVHHFNEFFFRRSVFNKKFLVFLFRLRHLVRTRKTSTFPVLRIVNRVSTSSMLPNPGCPERVTRFDSIWIATLICRDKKREEKTKELVIKRKSQEFVSEPDGLALIWLQ